MKPTLLRHLDGESFNRFPVWMMRQAGRYLPEYQAIRKTASFWEMVTRPELASEVSLLPIRVLPVDAVIFFSDILTLPYGLGLHIEMKEGVGPVIHERITPANEGVFADFSPERHCPFVGEALAIVREKISPEMALLGFAGAPWTLASYLIEGGASRNFENVKGWMLQNPSGLSQLLDRIADATIQYLQYQVKNGAHMVQLFDTWIGEMPVWFFQNYYSQTLNRIFDSLGKDGIRVIYFAKNSYHLVEQVKNLNAPALSVDGLVSLPTFDRWMEGKFSLQGNLDPILLLKGTELEVRLATQKLVAEARTLKKPAIMNLGHGILPKTPVANAKAFIEEARAQWA